MAVNLDHTIVESSLDSLRFTLNKTLHKGGCRHPVSISSFVNPKTEIMGWHDSGNFEGPDWAANAVGGAWDIYAWGDSPVQPRVGYTRIGHFRLHQWSSPTAH